MKLLTKENKNQLPPLGATDPLGDQALVKVKFFSLANDWRWYATEFDGIDTFFGLVSGWDLELGYFSLKELSEVTWRGIPAIERDRGFTPMTLAKVREQIETKGWA